MPLKFDKEMLDSLIEGSNLQFFSSGILTVSDPLFVTKWVIKDETLESRVYYSHLKDDHFKISTKEGNIPDSWNQFGFNQSFSSDEQLNAPYHRNKHIELHYVAKGSFKLKVNQTIVNLNAGDICIINPHCYHSDIIPPNKEELELYIVGINEEALESIKAEISAYPIFNNSFKIKTNISEYVIMRQVESAHFVIESLVANIKSFKFDQTNIKYLDNLFAHEYEFFEEVETSRNTMLFEELRSFIHRNFKMVTLEDLEFYFNFSKDHISRIIKSESGLTFSKYSQKVKLDNAITLLINSDLSIKSVMEEVGYKNESHFYKLFKTYTGINPNDYRLSNS